MNKEELKQILNYAIEEYGKLNIRKDEFISTQSQIAFGSITGIVSAVEAGRGIPLINKYKLSSDNEELSFVLGVSSVLYAYSGRKYRKELVENNGIRGVAVLNHNHAYLSSLPLTVIVLGGNNRNTWFCELDDLDLLAYALTNDFSDIPNVYYSESVSSESLSPDYYNPDNQVKLGANTVRLRDIAELIAGRGTKDEYCADEGIPYLRGRDIQNGNISTPDKFVDYNYTKKYSKCLLQEGDILLTKHFGNNKLAFVKQENLPAIASDMLVIIRAFDVSERYLYDYLTSETGKEAFSKQLKRVQKGVFKNVTLPDLGDILIPVFDEETMLAIENGSSISKSDMNKVVTSLMARVHSEKDVESKVHSDLVAAGWDEERLFLYDKALRLEMFKQADVKYVPDLVYQIDEKRFVLIDTKVNLQRIKDNVDRARRILEMIGDGYYIITTGFYYEVHKNADCKPLMLMHAPTIEEMQKWDKEVC